jgi:nitrate/nitrite transporter NarK
MQIPYDVLFWMVVKECIKKSKKSRKRKKKLKKIKEKKTYGLPSRFILCLFYVFVIFD